MEKTQFGEQKGSAATPLRTEIEAKAAEAVINGTQWLTALAVGKLRSPRVTSEDADWWQKEGKVFAIECAGETLYPSYIFDVAGIPIAEVEEILMVFSGYRPIRIASWFESTNSMLHGKRPREVLALTPKEVLEAARDHVAGAVHG